MEDGDSSGRFINDDDDDESDDDDDDDELQSLVNAAAFSAAARVAHMEEGEALLDQAARSSTKRGRKPARSKASSPSSANAAGSRIGADADADADADAEAGAGAGAVKGARTPSKRVKSRTKAGRGRGKGRGTSPVDGGGTAGADAGGKPGRKIVKTSQFRGVRYCKRSHKWIATICFKGKTKRLGVFLSEDKAAHAYDEAAYGIMRENPDVPPKNQPKPNFDESTGERIPYDRRGRRGALLVEDLRLFKGQ